MKHIILIAFALGAAQWHAAAQMTSIAPKLATPQSQGFSATRLQRLDNLLNNLIKDGQLNGATVLLARNGNTFYYKSFGYANVEQQQPMRNDHIYRIASMTKPVVSVALMTLYEEGKFLLDDPVSKFIPEFKNPVVLDKYNAADTTYSTRPAKNEITIRNLLTHTSGLGYAQIGAAQANAIYYKAGINGGIGTPFSTLKHVIPRLAKLPLFQDPGSAYLYGLNTDVAGYLVEVISGMPLDRFLQERIFAPLGMSDTYFNLPAAKQSRLVPLYMQDGEGRLRVQDSLIGLNGTFHRDFPKTPGGTYFSGGAGLASTAYDYALFAQMLANGGQLGGKRILGPATIKLMTSNHIGDFVMFNDTNKPRRFGLGFGIATEYAERSNMAPVGTYGWDGMFASTFVVDPVHNLLIVMMRNIWPTRHWDLNDRIKPLIYQAME